MAFVPLVFADAWQNYFKFDENPSLYDKFRYYNVWFVALGH
jgi:hypothetical protein